MFETGLDPVTAGLVKSLNRPEGNVTGVTSLNLEVAPKGLELLHELLPQAKSIAVLINPTNRVNFDIMTKGLEGPSNWLSLESAGSYLAATRSSIVEGDSLQL